MGISSCPCAECARVCICNTQFTESSLPDNSACAIGFLYAKTKRDKRKLYELRWTKESIASLVEKARGCINDRHRPTDEEKAIDLVSLATTYPEWGAHIVGAALELGAHITDAHLNLAVSRRNIGVFKLLLTSMRLNPNPHAPPSPWSARTWSRMHVVSLAEDFLKNFAHNGDAFLQFLCKFVDEYDVVVDDDHLPPVQFSAAADSARRYIKILLTLGTGGLVLVSASLNPKERRLIEKVQKELTNKLQLDPEVRKKCRAARAAKSGQEKDAVALPSNAPPNHLSNNLQICSVKSSKSDCASEVKNKNGFNESDDKDKITEDGPENRRKKATDISINAKGGNGSNGADQCLQIENKENRGKVASKNCTDVKMKIKAKSKSLKESRQVQPNNIKSDDNIANNREAGVQVEAFKERELNSVCNVGVNTENKDSEKGSSGEREIKNYATTTEDREGTKEKTATASEKEENCLYTDIVAFVEKQVESRVASRIISKLEEATRTLKEELRLREKKYGILESVSRTQRDNIVKLEAEKKGLETKISDLVNSHCDCDERLEGLKSKIAEGVNEAKNEMGRMISERQQETEIFKRKLVEFDTKTAEQAEREAKLIDLNNCLKNQVEVFKRQTRVFESNDQEAPSEEEMSEMNRLTPTSQSSSLLVSNEYIRDACLRTGRPTVGAIEWRASDDDRRPSQSPDTAPTHRGEDWLLEKLRSRLLPVTVFKDKNIPWTIDQLPSNPRSSKRSESSPSPTNPRCFNDSCDSGIEGRKLYKCALCVTLVGKKTVRTYCRRDCQKAHWKARHRLEHVAVVSSCDE